MKKNIFISCCCFILFIIINCEAQKDSFVISDNHFNQDIKDSCSIFTKVFNNGKKVIPLLIQNIDINEKSRVGFYDINSSGFYEFSQNNYKGIKAAYLIDLLLSRDSISNKNDINLFNLYGYCVIVRQNNSENAKKVLQYKDMKKIKSIYIDWWKKNKYKSMKQLRREWKKNGSIIESSNFKWI